MNRRRWAIAVPLGVAALSAAWLAAASALFQSVATVTLPTAAIRYSLTLWPEAFAQRHLGWRVVVPLAVSGLVPTLPLLIAGVLIARRAFTHRPGPPLLQPAPGRVEAVIRGGSDNHGHADWMAPADALALLRPVPGFPALVIGELGGPLLFDPCRTGSPHSIIFAGTGGYKTSTVITRLLAWTGNAIVLDPSREIGPIAAEARSAMGQAVFTLGLGAGGLDVLGAIDITAPSAPRRILSVVASICGEEPERHENSVFADAGRNLITALLAFILYDPDLPASARTLAYFRTLITTPEDKMRGLLAQVAEASPSPLASLTALTLMGLAEETFSGAYFNATQFCSWLFDDAVASLVSGVGGFRASSVVERPTTVFIQIPLDVLMTTPAVARVLIDALAWAFIDADGVYFARTLLLVDEASKLGRMKSLEIVRDTGRKYGLTLHLAFLSEAEITDVWGRQGVARWFANLSWRGYNAVADRDTARCLSDESGTYGAVATSEGDNRGNSSRGMMDLSTRSRGANTSIHEISRRLILASEILAAPPEEMFVIRTGGASLRCTVAPYFRRPEFAGRLADNRFNRAS